MIIGKQINNLLHSYKLYGLVDLILVAMQSTGAIEKVNNFSKSYLSFCVLTSEWDIYNKSFNL